MTWVVKRTDTFLESLKAIKKNEKALEELDKKIKRLQEDPIHVGGWLSGELHGKKATRITKKYRLIFTPDKVEKIVYLNWIDHREHAYQFSINHRLQIFGINLLDRFTRTSLNHHTVPVISLLPR